VADREHILVVDDNESNRYAVGRMVRAAGFETSEAMNGRQAIRLARTNPDAIVIDVNLPDMSGYDVVREIRGNPNTSSIPIVHLSASYMRDEDRVFGLDNGANAYLTHPVEPTVLVATIRSLIRFRRVEDQQRTAGQEWQATFDAIRDLVCVVNESGAVTRANRAALTAFGRETPGGSWVVFMSRAFPGIDAAALRALLVVSETTVREFRAGDCWLRIAVHPLPGLGRYTGSQVCVVTDVTPEKQAEVERTALLANAERARQEAEAANGAKNEFLATMSHEIRTPINAILGYAQLLDMGLAGSVSAEQRQQLDRLRRSAAHLLQLVNELFDLGAVDAGGMRLERELALVDDVVEDALAIGRPLAFARGIRIETEGCGDRHLFYVADTGRVRQILVNLLSNAVKFSAPGARIMLKCETTAPPTDVATSPDRRYIAIRVSDSGVGVSEEQLDSIFDPFVQGDSGTTRAWGGSGLGLTISRRLARLMGGDITVTSAVGHGSAFTLWLPAGDDQSLIETAEQATPRAANAPFDPIILAQLGRIVSSSSLTAANAVMLRLRTDTRFARASMLSDAQLIDHLPAHLVDIGLALVIVAEVGLEASSLLHDGSAIRTEIAERHGAQRRRLGWTMQQVELEYDIIREELERLLRGRHTPVGDVPDTRAEAHAAGAVELITRLLDQSRAASVRGFKEASGVDD